MISRQVQIDEARVRRALEARRPYNVLLVDDEEHVRTAWSSHLGAAGGLVYSVKNSDELSDIVELIAFDAALVDLNLDKDNPTNMDGGREVIRILAQASDGTRTSAITGKEFKAVDGFQLARNFGVENYFEKGRHEPDPTIVLEWLLQVFGDSGLSRQKQFDRTPIDLNPHFGLEASIWLRHLADLLELPDGETGASRLIRVGAFDMWPFRLARAHSHREDSSGKAVFFNVWSRAYGLPLILGIGLREGFEARYLRSIIGGRLFDIPLLGEAGYRIESRGQYATLRAVTKQTRSDFEAQLLLNPAS